MSAVPPLLPTYAHIPLVRRAWTRCVTRLLMPASHGVDDVSEEHFRRFVFHRYTEPQRHYHTLEHLEEMLGHLSDYEAAHGWQGRFRPALADGAVPLPESASNTQRLAYEWTGTAVLLSVLFHDAVYDPTRGDNEEASAALAIEFLDVMRRESDRADGGAPADVASPTPPSSHPSASSPTTTTTTAAASLSDAPPPLPLLWADAQAEAFVRDTTAAFILKTKEHLSVQPRQPLRLPSPSEATGTAAAVRDSVDDPLHVFLDLDLAILGHPSPDVYRRRYAENVAREYSHYPRADFLKGRAAFLTGFAQHAQWFKTPFFFYKLEAQARRNTAQEVAELTAELQAARL
ncbi:hd phosphohydrolase family protein [Novymonas esmeraldas]|uniref:Hd phosphohydrolase family protein n=1 Tax=Novymonas esmeraldas TaxID=1808958 RepID=A0AAW0EXW9_9TRYP